MSMLHQHMGHYKKKKEEDICSVQVSPIEADGIY